MTLEFRWRTTYRPRCHLCLLQNDVSPMLLQNDMAPLFHWKTTYYPSYSRTTCPLCFTGERRIAHVTTERHVPCVLLENTISLMLPQNDMSLVFNWRTPYRSCYHRTTCSLCFTGERRIAHVTTERHVPCVLLENDV